MANPSRKIQIPKETSENLQRDLTTINENKKQLEDIKTQLQQLLIKINDLLPEQHKIWSDHTDKFITASTPQLKDKLGVTLTTEEKEELHDPNFSDVEEKRKKLKSLNIDVETNATDFAVGIYDSATSAQSRNLQKIGDISRKIKSLPIIKDEDTNAQQIITQYQKQYAELLEVAIRLEKQALAVPGISEEELENIQKLVTTIKTLQEPTLAPKVAGELEEKLD